MARLRWFGACSGALSLFVSSAAVAQASHEPQMLSGELRQADQFPDGERLRLGFVADSQLQTRANYDLIPLYRSKLAEIVVKTAIRPPALDWAARAILWTHLLQLKQQGAAAIFYLGDGANNGCYDEYALGYPKGSGNVAVNEEGILALLDRFRREERVPVYFILGNHDVLGAGSTSTEALREKFCKNSKGAKPYVTKLDAMRLANAFNAANKFPSWTYKSSFDEQALERNCKRDASIPQHRSRGCYLAGAVDYRGSKGSAQFLLLDTNDWADVSSNSIGKIMQEGIRGAMTFVDDEGTGITSQTTWFDRHASGRVNVRLGLSHYDVRGLTRLIPFLGKTSSKTQRYMNLFTAEDESQSGAKPEKFPVQDKAYIVTGHTHAKKIANKLFKFSTDCGTFSCAKTNQFRIRELNVGSTTDYSNYATIAQIELDPSSESRMYYRRMDSEANGAAGKAACIDVWNAIPDITFPEAVKGHDKGWLAIGIDRKKRTNYQDFDFGVASALWRNLDAYAGADRHKANCIGLYAAAVEAGVNPLKRLPPK